MYKGQFAKWKWTKYNKSGNPNLSSTRYAKSRVAKKKRLANINAFVSEPDAEQQLVLVPQARKQLHLFYFNNDECEVETTLSAYAVMISHWAERETPWRTPCAGNHHQPRLLFNPQKCSILQHVRAAQDCFMSGRPQQGGELLRHAFLGIETSIHHLGLDVEALWDCWLAVPQLVLATGWTDMLLIFSRYLFQLTSIKLPPSHPLVRIAAGLHKLSFSSSHSPCNNNIPLQAYLHRAWHLWITLLTTLRGPRDDLTIHLKRGYVTLLDPSHPMARDIISDFGVSLHNSLSLRGPVATTARILELEHLLVRMFLPLFVTREAGERAKGLLRGLVARIEGKEGNVGRGRGEWEYMDRHLVFSANYFMAAIADYTGDEKGEAEEYRRRCLDLGEGGRRDVFWAQTAGLLEQRLRMEGRYAEADVLRGERMEVEGELGVSVAELEWEGDVGGISMFQPRGLDGSLALADTWIE